MDYFNPRPKRKKEDLFNFEKEFSELKRYVKDSPFILIKGRRRTGKTSLILTSIHEFNLDAIFFDLRALPSEEKISISSFYEFLSRNISEFLEKKKKIREKFMEIIKKIKGIEIMGSSIWLKSEGKSRADLFEVFEIFNKIANKSKIFLVFDEAQELRRLAGYRMDKLFAYIYDNFPNLSIIVSGSQSGLIDGFLRLKDPNAPLYGRAVDEIWLRPFNEEEAKEFLIRGYKKYGIKPSKEFIEYALKKMDGIPGWLTFLGWNTRNKKRLSLDDVDKVLDIASELAIEEFNHFLKPRKQAEERYKFIMKIIAEAGGISWSRLKSVFEIKKGKISDKTLLTLLRNLKKGDFIDKRDNKYFIPDPVLRFGFLKGR